MKILLTVDPEIPVPPTLYGGIERIVDGLAIQYKKLGHEVILLAHQDSKCQGADRIYPWKGRTSVGKRDIATNALQLWGVFRDEHPDIIHSFSRLLYLYPLFLFSRAKIVQSYQRESSPRSTGAASKLGGPRLQFAACAAHLFQKLPHPERWQAIYNFTDTNSLAPDYSQPREYLLFLGRIEDIKGTREAIEVAKRSGERLVIAGNVPPDQTAYFEREVRPFLDGVQISYIGPVDDKQKKQALQKAKALLFPIKWEEPFGIVLAEALACGVPILGFRRGSVPEVVEDGLNGFVCESVEDMAEAVKKLWQITAQTCRCMAEERFSAEVIARQYIGLYERHIRG